jgi:hypothetical protein
MDRKPAEKSEIERLIRLSERSRQYLGEETARLRRKLDIPQRLRESVAAHPLGWFSGSLVSGLLASFLLRRRRVPAVSRSRGVTRMLLGLTLTAARPLAKLWLSNQAARWLGAAGATSPLTPPVSGRPVPRPLPGSQSP